MSTTNHMSYVKRETVIQKKNKAQKNKGKRGTSQRDKFFEAFDNLKPDEDKGLSIPVKGQSQKEMKKFIRNHRALAYQYNREVLAKEDEDYKIKTVSDKDSKRMYFIAVYKEDEETEQAA